MGWSFNPFTGNLDQTGSGAVVFEGEEETFDDLPVGIGDPPVGSSYLVRTSTGVWLVNRRQAGIWIRRNNTGVRATDWEYGGDYPVNSVNGQTGNVVLSSSNVGAIPTLTVTNVSVAGNATTNLTAARNALVRVTSSGALSNTFILPVTDNQEGDLLTIFAVSITGQSITIRNSTYTLIVTIGQSSRSRSFLYTGGAWTETTVNVHTHPATDITGTFSTLSANNGNIIASSPVLDLSQTWNNAAVAFIGAKFNATDTASSVNSSLVEFQLNGASYFRVQKEKGTGLQCCVDVGTGPSASVDFQCGGNRIFRAYGSGVGNQPLYIEANGGLQFAPISPSTSSANLQAEAANTLACRQGSAAQTFNIYNTFTNASNYERGFMRWSSNVLQIGTEAGGTGSARALELQTGGTTRFTIATNGQIFCSSSLSVVSNLVFQGNAAIVGNIAAGVLRLIDNAGTSFNRLQFGGGTTSFPALKRSSTVLQSRLADDSDFAPLQGQLRTHANAVSETITATHTLTLYDAAGTAYKVPCVAA